MDSYQLLLPIQTLLFIMPFHNITRDISLIIDIKVSHVRNGNDDCNDLSDHDSVL